jgi:hypothetical protein
VTIPTRTVSPDAGFTAAAFNYGNESLRAYLYWPRGTLSAGPLPGEGSMATLNPDGSVYVKVGWWRGRPGRLRITGRRIDAPARPFRFSASDGYGLLGFQPSGITFPATGCWRVTGRVRQAKLTFVVRVIKVRTS